MTERINYNTLARSRAVDKERLTTLRRSAVNVIQELLKVLPEDVKMVRKWAKSWLDVHKELGQTCNTGR